jgi:hypothetical protein
MTTFSAGLSYLFLAFAVLFWVLNVCVIVESWRIRRRGETRNISGFAAAPQLCVILSAAADYWAGGTSVPNVIYWGLALVEIYPLLIGWTILKWLKKQAG